MKRNQIRVPQSPAERTAQRPIPFAEQDAIMARARRQRAEEVARLMRVGARRLSKGIEAIFLWVANYREAARNMG